MRITGGRYRSRIVTCPPGIIRPAMDRMRESVFAVLGPLDDLAFLDLFSGSGIMALEAASRGAKQLHLVELDRGKRTVIQKNLTIAEEEMNISFQPVERFIRSWKQAFDIIYLDPPFDYPNKGRLLARISASKLLKEETRVLIHYPKEDNLPDCIEQLELYDRREYGRSIVGFYSPDGHKKTGAPK